jgi:membrane protein
MARFLGKARKYLTHDVWNTELSSISGVKRLAARLVRVAQLVIKGFREDDLPVHSAALTFITLIALVPLLAIVFSIMKGLGAAQDAMMRLNAMIASMPEQFQQFVQQILDIAGRTNFTALGWLGVVFLFVTVVQMLVSIENSFNRVWGVKSARSWLRRFTNYTSITVVVPVLIVAAFTIGATLQNEAIKHGLSQTSAVYSTALRVAPLLSVWVAFFFLIVFMPNTRVRRRPAAASALIAALLWIGWQGLYITMQKNVANYNAIYGTFAAVPIFLLWLSVSWMIVLLGSEIAFALQNHGTFHMERSAAQASVRARITLGLSVLLDAARRFERGDAGVDAAQYAQAHFVPVRLLNDVIRILARGGLLAELADTPDRYALLKSPDRIEVGKVIELITRDGSAPEDLGMAAIEPAIEKALNALDSGLRSAVGETTFAQLLKQ